MNLPPRVLDDYEASATALFGRDARVERVPGSTNPVFRVRVANVVKVIKFASSRAIEREAAVIGWLAAVGVPVPEIEAVDANGVRFDLPFLVMASAGEATVLQRLARRDSRAEDWVEQMGTLLARVHATPIPASDVLDRRDPDAIRTRLQSVAGAAVQRGLLSPDDVAIFKALPWPELNGLHLCHGDYHAVQCLERDRRISAIVDWEEAWAGNATVDLGIALSYLDMYGRPDWAKTFVTGYRRVRELPADFAEHLGTVRLAHALTLMASAFGRGDQALAARAADVFRSEARIA